MIGSFLIMATAMFQDGVPDPSADGKPVQSASPEIVVEGERPDPPKKRVCRRSVETGSIMPKVTCRSQEDWDLIAERSIETTERLKAERRARDHVGAMRDNPS